MEKVDNAKGLSDIELNELVNRYITQMTLDEKLDQMSGNGILKYLIKDRNFGVRAYPGGGVERLKIPPFLFTDGPRGVIIPGSTCFPVSMARGATWDIDLEEEVGEAIGKEVRAHGGNLFGGVCINLLRHPAWGRAQETYGEDPFLLGMLGTALLRGVQKHNVMATIKHYALNSIEDARFKVNVEIDERTLREVYLPHFKYCIEQGCATVMSAYNKMRGEYCGHNAYLLREILKKEWGFKGFVHSDWMWGLRDTIGGITGGLDVEMPRKKYYGKKLKRAIRNGKVPVELIDDAARRVIRTVLKFTTREDPQEYTKDLIGCENHVLLSRKVAEKSMVLLKNDRNLLPFDKHKIKTLAVIGPLANLKNTGDHGSSYVKQNKIITPLQGIKRFSGEYINILYHDGSDLEDVKNLVASADAAVIIVGYTYKDEGESIPLIKRGGDRINLGLKSEEIELIKVVSEIKFNSVIVLVGGSAIIMEEWKNVVPSIIMAWYSGMEGGTALANILFGKVNPSGKLPVSIPKDPADLPFFDRNADEIEYGYYHGYTLMDKKKCEPAFPFGFGLSYTNYNYKNLQAKTTVDSIIASVTVSNIGSIAGEEIAQLYIGFENSAVDRPLKILRGFKKIPLEPDESKTISIEVKKKDLAWYNPETKSWEIEDMKYSIYVGSSSSANDLLKIDINL